MLTIRMQRIGRRNQPSYRIVVIDSMFGPKSGRFIERVGHYNPLIKDRSFNKDRLLYWIGKGASLSDTVYNFCIQDGLVEGKKKNALSKHRPIANKKEEDVEQKKETKTPLESSEVTQEDKISDEDKDEGGPKTPPEKDAAESPPKEE